MSRFDDQPIHRYSTAGVAVDEGLRRFMLGVYNYMALGLGLTGLISYFLIANPAIMMSLYSSGISTVFMFAPLVIGLVFGFRINKMEASTAQLLFWLYAATMGVSLSFFLIGFTTVSVARIFFLTAGVFGSMSLYGYTTKKDLTSMGSFLYMGVWGIFLAGIVNLFMQSSAIQFALSVLGVIIFTGLTAYDTQQIKEIYYSSDSQEVATKKTVLGALHLYIDFIQIFVRLLYLFGDRR